MKTWTLDIQGLLASAITGTKMAERELRGSAGVLNIMARRPQVKEAAFNLSTKHIHLQEHIQLLQKLVGELNRQNPPWKRIHENTLLTLGKIHDFMAELERVHSGEIGWMRGVAPVDFPRPLSPTLEAAIGEIVIGVNSSLKWVAGALDEATMMMTRVM